MPPGRPKPVCPSPCRHRPDPYSGGHACVDRRGPAGRPDRTGGQRGRPRPDRRRRGLRGDQGRRRPAVRARPAPGAAGPLGRRSRARRRRRGARARRRRGGARRPGPAARPDPDHADRGTGPARLRPRRPPDDRGRRGGADAAAGGHHERGDVPWPRNERGALAGLKTTSYAENVVALAEGPRARRDGGDLRQPRRPPVRGHRLQRLLRRRRRAAHPHARLRLPGRGHPGAAARVVRRRRGRRGRSRSPRRPTRSSSSRPPATCSRSCGGASASSPSARSPRPPRRRGAPASRSCSAAEPPGRQAQHVGEERVEVDALLTGAYGDPRAAQEGQQVGSADLDLQPTLGGVEVHADHRAPVLVELPGAAGCRPRRPARRCRAPAGCARPPTGCHPPARGTSPGRRTGRRCRRRTSR